MEEMQTLDILTLNEASSEQTYDFSPTKFEEYIGQTGGR